MSAQVELGHALASLGRFMERGPLTATIAELEHDFDGRRAVDLAEILADTGVSLELLQAARFVREHIGRVNDVIHATAIAIALPQLLEPDEVLRRPSLAAGNDRTRPFDVETDRRIAEFKLADWAPRGNAMRQRQAFKDLVNLAADRSGRAAELYVLGPRPIRFLSQTKSKVGWGLDRAPATKRLFEERFGSVDQTIGEFVRGAGAHVKMVDLEQCLPATFARR